MEIKTIKLKNKNNTNIFLADTDRGVFELHSEIIVKHNLKTGEFSDDLFFVAVNESDILIATEKSMKYISSKLKTEKQIKDYLYKQNYHANVVNPVIEKLKEYNLINDQHFAKSYINSNKNYSANKLKQKLSAFGIKLDTLDDVFADTDVDDLSSCKTHAQKFLKNKVQDKSSYEKLVRHLLSKGYNYDTIKSTLNFLKLEVNDY